MRRTLVSVVTAMTLAAAPAAAQAVPPEPDRTGLQTRLDEVVTAGSVGALAEVRHERGVWRSSSGVAELGRRQPVPVHGRVRVGSITKTFLATVVLQLVGEHRLRLDDPVEAWLPGVVPDGDRITVRHLLNHTSGLYDYLDTLPMPPTQDFFDNRWRTWSADELLQRALVHPPEFEPGSTFSYSNTNYLLLGEIVAAVTGRSYGQQIERRIIRPLHLRGTSVPGTRPRILGPHPHGYLPTLQDGGMRLLDYTEMNPSVMGAGGEMISTTRDLNRFFAALLGGRLLPDHLLEEMTTPGVVGATFGLGLAWRDTTCGVRVYGHDGDALAYRAWSFSTPDGRRQVSIAHTPDFRRDPDRADERVDALLNQAVCADMLAGGGGREPAPSPHARH